VARPGDATVEKQPAELPGEVGDVRHDEEEQGRGPGALLAAPPPEARQRPERAGECHEEADRVDPRDHVRRRGAVRPEAEDREASEGERQGHGRERHDAHENEIPRARVDARRMAPDGRAVVWRTVRMPRLPHAIEVSPTTLAGWQARSSPPGPRR